MKKVIVDMDGVMADVYHQLVQFEKRDTGREIEISNLTGKPEIESFPNGKKHVNEVGFFRTLPVMKGSREAMEYLNNKYDLYIVSAGMEFPNSLREKYDWLAEHFPFITWEQIVLCGSKKVVSGDVMIDDYPKNLDHFTGDRLIFTQPHNELIENDTYQRVHTWEEVMNIL